MEKKKTIFLLGDSIAFYYKDYLGDYLKDRYLLLTRDGKEEAARNLNNPVGTNSGDSGMVLNYIRNEYRNNRINYDYFLFNCGLHDIKTDPETKKKLVSTDEYKRNLEQVLDIMEERKVKAVWITTTPVDDFTHNSRVKEINRFGKDVIEYNAIALEIMSNRKIPVIDLYLFTNNLGIGAYCDHVHYTKEVTALQAAYISGALSIIESHS